MNHRYSLIVKGILSLLIIMLGASFTLAYPIVVSGGTENDYESWIERLPNDTLMVVFCRNPDWASGDLYVTFSGDEGQTWSAPQAIISRAGDQATLSFAVMPSDTIRLFYASNEAGSYKIYSAWSLDGVNWTDEGIVDLGWAGNYQYYDPTVALEPDGSLTMSYVVMSNGVYVAHCPAGGQWDTLKTQVAGTSSYRPRLMKHSDGTYLYAYHTRTGGQSDYDVFVRNSTDRLNWSEPVRITTNLNSHDPFVCEMFDGAYMISYAKAESGIYSLRCRFSYDGEDWGDEVEITDDHVNSTQPHVLPEDHDLYLTYAYEASSSDDHDVCLLILDYYTAIKDDPRLAYDYKLKLECYPNPFNARANINFTIDTPQQVRLDIFNVLGQHVTTLVDGYLEAGNHSITWNANAEPSGIYFARLISLEKIKPVRLVLLK